MRLWFLCFAAGIAVTVPLMAPSWALSFEIKQAGKLQVPTGSQLIAFSTDPTIQEVLSQDFSAAARTANSPDRPSITVSVNVNQQTLKPGVSLMQLAPGDPQVADLLRAAGANPPPLGDTGNEYDQAALARRMAARDYMPTDTQSSRLINSIANPGSNGGGLGFGPPIPLPCSAQTVARPGCPPMPDKSSAASTGTATPARSVGDVDEYLARKDQTRSFFGSRDTGDYDTVVVARASVSGVSEEMTLVAISHPGEDVTDAKKLIAERIANSILR